MARLLWGASEMVSVERASALGDWVGRRIGPRLRKHRHVVRNLSIVFPERDAAWIERTARASWGQIGRVLAEYPHLAALCATGPDRRIELCAHFDLEPLRRGTRPAILVAMHQANWNLPALTGVLGALPFTGVFGRQQNPLIEERIERYRNAMPARLIDAADGPRPILAELSEGRSVGLHMDHRVDAGE
ncbi:MAG: lysophospholipid acyltransferase family protein, partial [Geminicoccaceae bacterium]